MPLPMISARMAIFAPFLYDKVKIACRIHQLRSNIAYDH